MKKIKTKADFDNLSNFEKAIVFIFFEWSGQAHISKKAINEFEEQAKFEIPIFEINPDDSEIFAKWVCEEVGDIFGYGSTVWLNNKQIVDFLKNTGKSGISELERKTVKHFDLS